MKFSEAIAKVEQNRELKFEAYSAYCSHYYVLGASKSGYYNLDVYNGKGGDLHSVGTGAGRFNGNIDLNMDWQQVQEPVDFMTAVNSGKMMRPADGSHGFMRLNSWLYSLQQSGKERVLELINGLWEIEP